MAEILQMTTIWVVEACVILIRAKEVCTFLFSQMFTAFSILHYTVYGMYSRKYWRRTNFDELANVFPTVKIKTCQI